MEKGPMQKFSVGLEVAFRPTVTVDATDFEDAAKRGCESFAQLVTNALADKFCNGYVKPVTVTKQSQHNES